MKSGEIKADCMSIEDEKEYLKLPQSQIEHAHTFPVEMNARSKTFIESELERGDQKPAKSTKYRELRETNLDDNAAKEQTIKATGDEVSCSTDERTKMCCSSVTADGKMPIYACDNPRGLEDANVRKSSLSITDDYADSQIQNNTSQEETYDNVTDSNVDEFTPLKSDNSNSDCGDMLSTAHGEPVEVVEGGLNLVELSWRRVLEEHKERRAREAVAALNQHRPFERSPFGYKSWLLRLSHRRRFEILIAFGLFLWLAFFIVLAIFMNGPSSKPEDLNSSVSTDRNSQANAVDHRPIINQSITINTTSYRGLNQSVLATTIAATSSNPLNYTEDAHTESFTAVTINNPISTPLKTDRTKSNSEFILAQEDEPTPTARSADAHTESFTAVTINNPISTPLKTDRTKSNSEFIVLAQEDEPTPTARSADAHTESFTAVTINDPISTPLETDRTKSNSEFILLAQEDKLTPTGRSSASSSQTTSHFYPTQNSQTKQAPHSSTKVEEVDVITTTATENVSTFPKLQQILQGMKPNYEIGLGRADITGPAADVNMMGYANPSQVAGGIHTRQYARTFLIAQGSSRVVFVNIDACMGSTLLKLEVLKKLRSLYGNLYTAENLCISGTHTHSAPAGFLQDVLFQITSMGYVPETLHAMVDGIVQSIQMAHNRLAPGYILLNKGELLESNINRSPAAYVNNPENERKKYKYDVDKEMVLLKFLDANGKGIGMLNWFAVHCTSMNNTNKLISGDNKGYAEIIFEREMNPNSLVGEGEFVAAFAQSNEGDVSPNTKGPHCIDTGLPCDNIHSTCDGKVQNCIASGPGENMFESTEIIARNQFQKALELYDSASTFLTGPVQFAHQYVDMTNQTVELNATHNGRTCKPAMGFSFAAGTTDGPGAFDFKQGDKSGNLFWKAVRNFLHSPSQEQTDCHYPKPILLDTGEMQYPYSWQPDVVDTQVFRIGQLLISAVPGEFSTMSGRRLKDAVLEEFSKSEYSEQFESVIAGLANTYSDYITTFEEYHVQRYEGASTIFGPHTLSAYIQQYKKLAVSLVENKPLDAGAKVQNLLTSLMSLVPGVVMDSTPFGSTFGDVLIDANDKYNAGETVKVQFVSGNPRNSPTINMTFLTVEKRENNDTWEVIRTDGDWDTKYIWERTSTLGNVRGLSEATITWETASLTPSAYYRINHYGHYKYFWNRNIYGFKGTSKVFFVAGKD